VKRVTRERIGDLYAIGRADARGKGRPVEDELGKIERLGARVDAVIAKGDALTVKALAINGNDLMRELGMKPSRRIGEVLEALLERVLDDPSKNDREALLTIARELLATP
jgi:tRNA nucleotidyltransferase (CCA-adding enzyme)